MKKQPRSSTNPPKKQFGDYIIGKTLGQGTFGKVKSAIHKPTNQNVAIKILEKSKISEVADVERVSREIHILKLIRHPNIVQLYEIIETPKQLFLITEYMQNGELFDFIVKNKRIDESQASRMFQELISGVEYIHKIGVVHRDLKPQNILLDYRKTIKIVDFGLSNTYKKGETLKTPCGSPCYAAPQMIKGEKYEGLKVDIWSCGVILFAMLCGYLPFEDPDTSCLYKKILSGSFTFYKTLSEEARDLINCILNTSHSSRYTIDQIRKHPWMKMHNNSTPKEGIIIGYNKIPIESGILNLMKPLSFDYDHVTNCLEANRHNNVTTCYYLLLKKLVMDGGISSCDLGSRSFDKSIIQPHRRKNTANKQSIMIDNYLTKHSEGEPNRKKSKSREKVHDKENRPSHNLFPNQSRKSKPKQKINDSFAFNRPPLTSKSNQRPLFKRDSLIENRLTRKYKQNFNQSLISKSKDKKVNCSRINSSVNGHNYKKDLQGLSMAMYEEEKKKKKRVNSFVGKEKAGKMRRI